MVVPTYNEVTTLEAVVDGILAHGAGVLVVDDASPDGTGRLADRLAVEHPSVSVLHRTRKDGLGRALAAGFAAAAGADLIAQMDADGSHDPGELSRLLAAIDGGADLAIGSRYVPGGAATGLSRWRALLSRGGNAYARRMLGLTVRDATSGFRVYRAEALAALVPSDAIAQGYAFQVEMAWRAEQAGFRVVEVPITFQPRRHGASKMRLGITLEALALVTRWGLTRRSRARRRTMEADRHRG